VPHRILWSWYAGRWRWAVTLGTARRGLGGAAAHPGPSSLYQCNSPPINGQCINHRIAV